MSHNEQVRTLEICHETGLHCRPSASFVKIANQFQSDIFVEKDGEKVNGKSIVGLLTLAADNGSKIQVTAIGEDAELALNALGELDFLIPVESCS
jgi:phosphocarrier protein HPr